MTNKHFIALAVTIRFDRDKFTDAAIFEEWAKECRGWQNAKIGEVGEKERTRAERLAMADCMDACANELGAMLRLVLH